MKIENIKPNPDNPRKTFMGIEELAKDIKKHGLMNPITVRPVNNHYEIVQGERRFKAVQSLGWPEIDVTIREVTKEQAQDMALAENLRREDLSVVELAQEFKKRLNRQTQKEIAESIGKSPAYVSTTLKFLELPQVAQAEINIGTVTREQGKELLRAMKYFKLLGYDDDHINSFIDQLIEFLYYKDMTPSKFRDIIDNNIMWRYRLYIRTRENDWFDEDYEYYKNGKKVVGYKFTKGIAPEPTPENLMEMLKWSFQKRFEWCNHEWETETEYYDDNIGDYVKIPKELQTRVCPKCFMLHPDDREKEEKYMEWVDNLEKTRLSP